jgi:hypothetical protein
METRGWRLSAHRCLLPICAAGSCRWNRTGARRLRYCRSMLREVDAHLPGGGLPLGHLHEVIEGGTVIEYAGLATLFAAGIGALPGRSSGVCAAAICLRPRLRGSAFIPTGSSTARHGKTATCSRRWKRG